MNWNSLHFSHNWYSGLEELNTHEIGTGELITEYFGFMGKVVAINRTRFNGHSTKTKENRNIQKIGFPHLF